MPHLPASIVPGLEDGDLLSSTFERWSLPTNFGTVYHEELGASANLRIVTGLTCTRIVPSADAGQIDHLESHTEDGGLIRVRAKRYVLAAGGLGTTRLLLASPDRDGVSIGNHSDHLGRWYMAHVEGVVADVQFTTSPEDTVHDYERDIDGVWVRRRFSFSLDTLRRLRMPNVVVWLANPDPPDARHGSGVLSFVYLILASPLGRFMSPPPQRLALTGHDVPGVPYGPVERTSVSSHLRNIARQPLQTARFAVSFGVGRFVRRGRKSPGFFVRQPTNRYPLMFHGEHLPERESRVVLDQSVDALGMPRLRIQARFTEQDVDGIVTAHKELDRVLREQGLGHVEYLSDDVAAHVRRRVGAGFHQAGTTRMADEPGDGVVDRNLAVHGYPDLYVASSSTFVTSSQANSTFMIVAFAVRLADHLRTQLR
jgi:choline dehydrogenase-like flavoprotein